MKYGYAKANTTQNLEKQSKKLKRNGASYIFEELIDEKEILINHILKNIKKDDELIVNDLSVLGEYLLYTIGELEIKEAKLKCIQEDWNDIFKLNIKKESIPSVKKRRKRWAGYDNKIETVIILEKYNVPVKEIAKITGLSKTTIYNTIKRLY